MPDQELPQPACLIFADDALDGADLVILLVQAHHARLGADGDLLAGRFARAEEDGRQGVRVDRRQQQDSIQPAARIGCRVVFAAGFTAVSCSSPSYRLCWGVAALDCCLRWLQSGGSVSVYEQCRRAAVGCYAVCCRADIHITLDLDH